jgi:hypothetical protein
MKKVTIKYKGEICGIEPVGGKRVRVFTTESWTTTKYDELVTWFTDLNRLSKKKAEKLVREALGFDPELYRMWK